MRSENLNMRFYISTDSQDLSSKCANTLAMFLITSRTMDSGGERGMGVSTTGRRSRRFSRRILTTVLDNDCQSVSEVASREYRGWLSAHSTNSSICRARIQKAEKPRRRTYNGKHEREGAGIREKNSRVLLMV